MEYLVMQGITTASGKGDYHLQGVFPSYKEAMECYNRIRNDKNGWSILNNQYLETIITDSDGEILNAYKVGRYQ